MSGRRQAAASTSGPASIGGSIDLMLGALIAKMTILKETLEMDLLPNERAATKFQLDIAMDLFKSYDNHREGSLRPPVARR